MNLLDFGMKNEKSRSLPGRMLAKAALAAEKKRADLYEDYLNKKGIPYREDPEEDAALLEKIREGIAGQ